MHALFLTQLIAMQAVTVAPVALPDTEPRPFAIGEVLVYEARASVVGRIGEATLRVDGPCIIGEREALMVSFDADGRAAFLHVQDETRSWIDAESLATIRYEKKESSPLGSHHESVTLLADQQRWQDGRGRTFDVGSVLPLDELSVLYYIRTLRLFDGDTGMRAGHFDSRRNPIGLRVLGRAVADVPAGRFDVVELELKVRDPRRYRGSGTIHVQLTDDERRIPVRIRTSLPGSATVTLLLSAARHEPATAGATCP